MAKGDVSYSAEFVVDLDRLKAGVVNAQTMLNKLETYFVETGKRSGDSISKGLNKGLNDASAALVRAKRDAKVYGDVTGDMTGAVEKTIQAHKDYIAALIKTAQANGDAEGSIKKLIAATREEIKALEAGKKTGENYADGLSQSVERFIPQPLKKISSLFESISPKLANSGKEAAMGFAKALGKLVPAALPIFTALIASSGGLLLVIGAIAVAIKAVSGAIKKAHDEQTAFNKAVKAQKEALDSAREAIDSINEASEKATENYESGERAAAAQHLVWQKIGEWFSNTFKPITDGIKNTFETITNAIGFIANKLGLVSDEEVTAAIEAQKLEGSYDNINKVSKEYQRTLKQINLDTTKGDREKLTAAQTYLDRLIEQRVVMAEQVGDGSSQVRNIDDLIERQTRIRDLLIESTKEQKESVTSVEKETGIIADREKLRNETNSAVRQMLLYASSISDEEERQRYIEQQKLGIYDNAKKSLAGIIDQYGATRENAKKTYEYWDELVALTDKEIIKEKELTELEKLREEIEAADLSYAQQTEAIEFKRTNNLIDETEYAEERQRAADEYNKTLATLAGKYKDVSGAADILNKAVREGAKKKFDFKGLSESLSQGVGYYQDAAGSVMSIIGSMAEDQIDIINKTLEEEQKAIDKLYEDTMAKLDEERQAALEAAGFAQSVTEEGLAASMEAAIASGDEGAIYREKRRQEELAINKKYDQLEKQAEDKKLADTKAAEEKAARETAEIQYRQAMTDWALKLAIAPAQIASAILDVLSVPFMIPVIAGLGALQLGAIIAAEPKKPAFKHGGIVGLPETYDTRYANGGIVQGNGFRGVDSVSLTAAPGEMITNEEQQGNLWAVAQRGIEAIEGGGGRGTLINNIYLDGVLIATNSVEHINNGQTGQIEWRMIRQ